MAYTKKIVSKSVWNRLTSSDKKAVRRMAKKVSRKTSRRKRY